jgi:Bacterial nucleoid DNA-binding protein
VAINKKQLVDLISSNQDQLSHKDVELSVKAIFESMADSLRNGDRIEIRGFGSFALRFRKSRTGRNPKSGETVNIQNRYVPHFKPGKDFRESVKEARKKIIT